MYKRQILSRLLYGSRITLYIVLLVILTAPVVGLMIGTVAGYFGGWIDTILMRITDIFLAFPKLILALALVAVLGPGMENAVLAIALTSWPPYARVARAETLTVRNSDYIAAVKLQGAGAGRVIWGHAVSYTHLNTNSSTFAENPGNADEDKNTGYLAWRNAYDPGERRARSQAAVLESDPAKRVEMYAELRTVSYTHLDVYKRQALDVQNGSDGPGLAGGGDLGGAAAQTNRVRARIGHADENRHLREGLGLCRLGVYCGKLSVGCHWVGAGAGCVAAPDGEKSTAKTALAAFLQINIAVAPGEKRLTCRRFFSP